ncbi:exosortase family protein XrtF [Halpernia frigidisoli]|uniref:Exosortase family protein XrtF n=1 Tax=Halpernia frigidisoli TaxID=1125876 RepID=A0A1I3HJK6_9FLAO|nr:exosortase family protein XrtF [Halpernia frigidisoli]SFI35968.1 exosortase family protein XrtF [Halpernia frigidisoli]
MFKDFLPILKVILRFIFIYLFLLFAYQFYLNYFENSPIDPFSKWVASQSSYCQNILGFKTELVDQAKFHTTWFYVNENYISRMVEGCNGISIMILFVAFIFVFYKGTKTFIFTGIGLVIIHLMNVFRIALLNIILVKFPEYDHMAHDYLFPAIIYGTIVVLWLVWVKYFVLKPEKKLTNEKF